MGIAMAMINISDFVESWIGKGDEKQDTQRFWMDLFQKVLGVEYPAKHLLFEKRVKEEYDCGKITSTAHGEPLQLRHPFLPL